MREIKFRAWHKAKKKMYQVCGMDYVINLDADCVEIDSVQCASYENGRWSNGGAYSIEDVVLMQSTGINDENGKEICEGDIVKRKSLVLGSIDITGTVKMYEGSWIIDDEYDAVRLWTECDENEVIGNIHENPELLEK